MEVMNLSKLVQLELLQMSDRYTLYLFGETIASDNVHTLE